MGRENTPTTRRNTLKMIGAAAAGIPALSGPASAAYTESDFSSDLDSIMDEYNIKGVSVAVLPSWISHRDAYVDAFGINYRRERPSFGYGYTDPLTTDHRLRIASISKTITSSAILSLIEDGEISSKREQVFGGSNSLPESEYGDPGVDCSLTVDDLLNHNYNMDTGRPVYKPNGAPIDYDLKETIEYIHENHEIERFKSSWSWGGSTWEYCTSGEEYHNYGYGVLGAFVEEVVNGSFDGGDTFESYVRDNVLPYGTEGMDTTETQHGAVENEGHHYSDYRDPYHSRTVREKAWAWGAWAGTAEEVAEFGRRMTDRFGDDYDLTECGWHADSIGYTDYVGHNGGQRGVKSALRCHDSRNICILMNTRNNWDDSPRQQILEIANDLAEEKFPG